MKIHYAFCASFLGFSLLSPFVKPDDAVTDAHNALKLARHAYLSAQADSISKAQTYLTAKSDSTHLTVCFIGVFIWFITFSENLTTL
jgi:hypothetical protein